MINFYLFFSMIFIFELLFLKPNYLVYHLHRFNSHGWGNWPKTTAPRSHFYLTPGNHTNSSLNCTSVAIENHCTRYELRLFWAKAFIPPTLTLLCLLHDRARAGTIFKVFGMTRIVNKPIGGYHQESNSKFPQLIKAVPNAPLTLTRRF